ncbi:MAG: hypothetical protein OXR66_02955 [Candidatus Woesearchaeota archaeon]|nr:hypothetical protein [Candidatus Woesearchaeota archaeon]
MTFLFYTLDPPLTLEYGPHTAFLTRANLILPKKEYALHAVTEGRECAPYTREPFTEGTAVLPRQVQGNDNVASMDGLYRQDPSHIVGVDSVSLDLYEEVLAQHRLAAQEYGEKRQRIINDVKKEVARVQRNGEARLAALAEPRTFADLLTNRILERM